MLKIGFGKVDLTPPLGVELSGFGPYIRRRAEKVRDNLWARAMAIESSAPQAKSMRLVIVSCDIIAIPIAITNQVRKLVEAATGLPADALMISCTHTHSAPATREIIGWGEIHQPWIEVLPDLIAKACIEALTSMREATISHAEVPCEGIARNREYDADNAETKADEKSFVLAEPEAALAENWRPNRPELADRTCHVLKIEAQGRIIGFVSHFGCHPVVCCEETRQIHGDYCGVATSTLEREHPGSIGLFLQGAQGDVNPGFVHQPEAVSMRALDIIAARFAAAVREGLRRARPLAEPVLRATRQTFIASRNKDWSLERLRETLAEHQRAVHKNASSDDDYHRRMNVVHLVSTRQLIARIEAGEELSPPLEVQGMRIGPLALLAAPLELFHAIKRDVVAKAVAPIPLILGMVNDYEGYAVDRVAAARGGYAAGSGPLTYTNIHDETVTALLALDAALAAPTMAASR